MVRELIGGIYFGQPKGFGVNEKGERTGQGHTLVHISAQPEPVLGIEATSNVDLPAQTEPFLVTRTHSLVHKVCSRQTEMWR